MATVHIPAAMRALTGGASKVTVNGATLGKVMESLEAAHPGMKDRLVAGDRIKPGFATFVNGSSVSPYLSAKLEEDAEIYFMPAISGGQ